MPNGWNGSLCSCVVVGSARNTDWPPHHWKLRVEYEDGSEITFTDTQGGLATSSALTAPQTVNHCRALVLTHCWTFQPSQNSLTWCRAIVPKWRHCSWIRYNFNLSLTVWIKSLRICASTWYLNAECPHYRLPDAPLGTALAACAGVLLILSPLVFKV